MKDTISTAISILVDDNVFSKVEGRRNWFIRTYDDSFVAMGWGEAIRRGLGNVLLSDMAKHNIHFFTFTYKKDFNEAIKTLIEAGMRKNN